MSDPQAEPGKSRLAHRERRLEWAFWGLQLVCGLSLMLFMWAVLRAGRWEQQYAGRWWALDRVIEWGRWLAGSRTPDQKTPGILIVFPALLSLMVVCGGMQWRVKTQRMRRERLGLCRSCGYDLRGTVAVGRKACPECGEEV